VRGDAEVNVPLLVLVAVLALVLHVLHPLCAVAFSLARMVGVVCGPGLMLLLFSSCT
jgi:hypothetical protein